MQQSALRQMPVYSLLQSVIGMVLVCFVKKIIILTKNISKIEVNLLSFFLDCPIDDT